MNYYDIPRRRRPLGKVVPPILFAIVVLCTALFPLRWPLSHVALLFVCFIVGVIWWGWVWGYGNGRDRNGNKLP